MAPFGFIISRGGKIQDGEFFPSARVPRFFEESSS